MMRSGNPALTANTFTAMAPAASSQYAMTIQGTVNKTAILLVLAILTASWTWNMYLTSANPGAVMPWMLGGAIGGFIVRHGGDLQEELGGLHRTHLRPAPRPFPRWNFLDARSAVPRNRHPSGRPDVRNAVCASPRVQIRPHQGHRKLQARCDRGHRRHRAGLISRLSFSAFSGSRFPISTGAD